MQIIIEEDAENYGIWIEPAIESDPSDPSLSDAPPQLCIGSKEKGDYKATDLTWGRALDIAAVLTAWANNQ